MVSFMIAYVGMFTTIGYKRKEKQFTAHNGNHSTNNMARDEVASPLITGGMFTLQP